jgi:tRNA(fMet)-specific endonuclease VapC
VSRYILDTNIVTLSQHGNSHIAQRAKVVGIANIFITTVTLEEQLKGRLAAISRCATKPELLPIAHQNLLITQRYFCNMNLLEFNQECCECFKKLRQQKINIGTQDLRIAAIALVKNAILVTQNYQDFIKVPDLKMEDWTVNI